MKRRNFIQALLGTTALAPLLSLIGRDPQVMKVAVKARTSGGYDFSGMMYHVNNSGTWKGLDRSTYPDLHAAITRVVDYDLKRKTVTFDTK